MKSQKGKKTKKESKQEVLKKLFECIEKDNYEQFKNLCSSEFSNESLQFKHENIHYQNVTLLFWAVKYNRHQVTTDLVLRYNANPNAIILVDHRKTTPFVLAITSFAGNEAYDKSLYPMCMKKAEVDVTGEITEDLARNYFNFLCRNRGKLNAIKKDLVSELEKIKEHLSSLISLPLINGGTLLKKMVEEKADVKIVNFLLQQGTSDKDIDFTFYGNFDLVNKAINENCAHLVKVLLEKRLLSVKEENGYKFINAAICLAHIEIWDDLTRYYYQMPLAYYLLKRYINQKVQTEREACLKALRDLFKIKLKTLEESFNNTTLLIQAVLNNDVVITHFLLEQGADPNFKAGYRYYPLFLALEKDNSQIFETLLRYGADPNVKSIHDVVPLMDTVIEENRYVFVKLLLKYGANINYYSSYLYRYLEKNVDSHLKSGMEKTGFGKMSITPLGLSFSRSLLLYKNDFSASGDLLKILKLFLKTYIKRDELLTSDLMEFLIGFLEIAGYLRMGEIESLIVSFVKNWADLSQQKHKVQALLPSPSEVLENPSVASKDKQSVVNDNVNNNNVSIPSASKDTQSAHAFLTALGFTAEDIGEMRKRSEENNKNKLDKIAKYKEVSFWHKYHCPESIAWANVEFRRGQLLTMSLGENRFFYLDTKALKAQGCSEEKIGEFQRVRLKFDNKHIKSLSKEYDLEVGINGGVPFTAPVTHELKIPTSEARILLAPLHSEQSDQDKKYTLYVGCKFLPDGIHELKDKKALKRSGLVEITLCSPEQKVAANQSFRPEGSQYKAK
jgi:hypothetical protein